jgi:alpha-L-rhamnosidase
MQEQFVDTPTREQGSWLWDGRNESQTAMDAFGDINLTRKSLLEFAQSQQRFWPDGAINKIYPTSLGAQQIPQFTEIYVDWVWQYWMHSGDRTLLSQLYPVVAKVAAFLAEFVNPRTGLITNVSGATDVARYPTDTQINLLAVNVFRRVAAMATALGRSPAAQQQREDALVAAINRHLVLPDGLYADGLNTSGGMVTTSSQTTDAFALEFGAVPPGRVATVASAVVAANMSSPPMSAGDLLEALRVIGRAAQILHLITDAKEPGWANILARGGTFTWEVWNPKDTDVPLLAPLASFYPGDSMSHGWGSNVVVGIQQTLLGVVPTAPGFASFSVTPPVVALKHASGTVPTPYGPIDVSWTRGSTMVVTVTVPAGTTAVVDLPDGTAHTIGSGTTQLAG